MPLCVYVCLCICVGECVQRYTVVESDYQEHIVSTIKMLIRLYAPTIVYRDAIECNIYGLTTYTHVLKKIVYLIHEPPVHMPDHQPTLTHPHTCTYMLQSVHYGKVHGRIPCHYHGNTSIQLTWESLGILYIDSFNVRLLWALKHINQVS